MILMLLWARKETTKHMVRVHADGTKQCFGSDTVSTWMFRMEEPSAFHTVSYPSRNYPEVLPAQPQLKKRDFQSRETCRTSMIGPSAKSPNQVRGHSSWMDPNRKIAKRAHESRSPCSRARHLTRCNIRHKKILCLAYGMTRVFSVTELIT